MPDIKTKQISSMHEWALDLNIVCVIKYGKGLHLQDNKRKK